MTTFDEFWPYYLDQHRHPACRALHYIAAVAAVLLLGATLVTGNLIFLIAAPIVSYGIAWFSHLAIEHNQPATWTYFRWSLIAEYKMFWMAVSGQLADELARRHVEAEQLNLATVPNEARD